MGVTISGGGSPDSARTWTTLQIFPDNMFKLIGSADATKTLVFELDGATAGADARFLWTGATDMDFTLPFATGTLAITDPADPNVQTYTGQHYFDGNAVNTAQLIFAQAAGAVTLPFQFLETTSGFGIAVNLDAQTAGDVVFTLPNVPNVANLTSAKFVMTDLGAGAGGAGGTTPTTQSLGNINISTSCICRTSTSTTGFRFVDNASVTAGAHKNLRVVLSSLTASTNNSMTFIGTAVRDWQFEDCTGSLAITGNENKTTAANASSGRVAKFNLTGQTGTIAATNITTSTAAGFYQINANVACTIAGTGSLNVNLAWTGDGGAKTVAIISGYAMTATGTVGQATYVVYLASGNITFTVTGTFTGTYALRLRDTYLGP